MGARYQIGRFVLVFIVALPLITAGYFLMTGDVAFALRHGLTWAVILATLFTTHRMRQSHGSQHSAICKDTPGDG
jgi:hypothetical protein